VNDLTVVITGHFVLDTIYQVKFSYKERLVESGNHENTSCGRIHEGEMVKPFPLPYLTKRLREDCHDTRKSHPTKN
jgi:hypothetical protein